MAASPSFPQQIGHIEIPQASCEFFHAGFHGFRRMLVGCLQGFQDGCFHHLRLLAQQAWIQKNPLWNLVARDGDPRPAIFTKPFHNQGIQILLKTHRILLDLLCLLEGFSELGKIGQSKAGHHDRPKSSSAYGTAWRGLVESAQVFDFRLQRDAFLAHDALLHQVNQRLDVLGLGLATIDDEIAMHR